MKLKRFNNLDLISKNGINVSLSILFSIRHFVFVEWRDSYIY